MNEQRTTTFQTRLPLILAVTLAIGMLIGQQLPHYGQNIRFLSGSNASGGNAETMEEVLRYIDAKYVDSVDIDHLKTDAINKMLSDLDPHSLYITPEEMQQVEEDMSGNFEGIGIEFLLLEDTITVTTPIVGGPSEQAGLRAGDRIVTIEDSIVAGVQIENKAIFQKLRGAKGSKVRLGILRGHENKLRQFTITRDVIPVNSVDVAYLLDDQKTAYIRINRFTARTQQEFMAALDPLVNQQHASNLMLDLRGNPGGYLNEAVDILSQFFPEGKLLVYTKGRTEERFNYKSSGRAQFNLNKLVVLIDEGSASASEIVAGAVQDHNRGWVIGRRSFGKGLVQEQYPLSNGGGLRLTVSRYYTPSGRCIQRDYTNSEQYAHEADRRLENGELSDPQNIKVADSTKYYTGMGRIVYGGGGITPDVFIPMDTSYANEYYFKMRQYLPMFAAKYMENHPPDQFPATVPAFIKDFQVSDAMMSDFLNYAAKEGVSLQEAPYQQCKYELRHQLKARIAKSLYNNIGLYQVLNDDDPAVEKAMQVLNSGEPIVKR
ncbi:MAG: S41 family peptidase [Lewinellaceae bacterium]|nr:S41 family peptidase [Lewinellaceae bacterium]